MATRFQWAQTLETFMNSKLVDRTKEGTPLVLTNSQFVIDGIIMAINDHPLEYRESHVAVQNIIVARSSELISGKKSVASAALSLYVAWCVYDAMCKGCTILELHQLACEALPALVANHMPLHIPPGSDRQRQAEASAEYGPLYSAMIQSWISGAVFPYSVLEKCTNALSQQIHQYHTEMAQTEENDSMPEVSEVAVARVLADLNTSIPLSKATGMGAIASFLNQYYAIGREHHICNNCGASLPSGDALKEHREYHRYLASDPKRPLWRLLAPSSDAFSHYGREGTDGSFAKIAALQSEIGNNNSSGRVQLPQM